MNITKPVNPSLRSFVLLAPPNFRGIFRKVTHSYSLYRRLQHEMQKLRGSLYLADGAISASNLSGDGRHILSTDDQSWHLLTVDAGGAVVGCTRFLQHPRGTHFDDLRLRESALADSDLWGARLRAAVEDELATAHEAGYSYVEVGGWAMDPEIRCTSECLRSVLATYAWSRLIGGAIGITTATERNASATILRKLGGSSLGWDGAALPPYFDPRYNCMMHMLRFDSRRPNPRYEPAIEELRQTLVNIPVVSPEKPAWQTIIRGFSPIPETAALGQEIMVHAV